METNFLKTSLKKKVSKENQIAILNLRRAEINSYSISNINNQKLLRKNIFETENKQKIIKYTRQT